MKKIIVIGGSNSKNSINKQLAIYAAGLLEDVKTEIIDLSIFDLPIFSVDYESEIGIPEKIIELSGIFDNTDGFIVSLAEHNGSYSVAFKNIFDWLSRINGKVWRDKPMLLLSTSPGVRGGQSVLETALKRFPYNGGNIIGSFSLPQFNDNFKSGIIINDGLYKKLQYEIENFQKSVKN
ncbi:MAG: NAD(P)H-dependent oxidoreductase [Bacteroidota bacterium]